MEITQKVIGCCIVILWMAGCGGGPSKLGGSCTPGESDSCKEGLVCDTDETCRKPVAAECDPSASESECVAIAECDSTTPPATCRLSEGETCSSGTHCAGDLDCFETGAGDQRCFGPVFLSGQVTGSDTKQGVQGARVIALDEQLLPVTDVATTDAAGNYALAVPILRNQDGSPISKSFTLRANAANYQTFPSGIRQALPIDTAGATKQSDKSWAIESAPTDVLLIALPSSDQGRAQISGKVDAGDSSSGVLVVAEETTTGVGYSGLTDRNGNFVIFNVADGDYMVRGYKVDLQVTPSVTTMAGADISDIVLPKVEVALATIEGGLQIVNAPNFTATSVVLAIKSTFDPLLGRGDIPAGLRAPRQGAPDVTGSWSIAGVPDGSYVVLAAFENDGEVRDPDTSIGGTATLEVTVTESDRGTTISSGSFKVTDALTTIGPGADGIEAITTTTPELTWGPDAGNIYYQIIVFNAVGEIVWDVNQDHAGSASSNQSITYAGAALQPDMIYQFRVISRDSGTDIPKSATEDLRGVFFLE